jgi:major membrane immunogen (membrane-anchored lipoprotein)
MKTKITVTTWFGYYDEEDKDEDFGGDCQGVDIYIDGKLVKSYGDYYHDKGEEKAEGFIDGVAYILGRNRIKVSYSNEHRQQ